MNKRLKTGNSFEFPVFPTPSPATVPDPSNFYIAVSVPVYFATIAVQNKAYRLGSIL